MFSNSGRCILSKIDQDGQGRISVVTEPVSSISLYGWSCSVIPWGWREHFRSRAISGPSRFGSLSKAIASSPVCGGVPPLLSHSAKIQRTGRAMRNSAQSTAGAIRIRVTPRDGIAASRPREPLRRVQDFASVGDQIDLLARFADLREHAWNPLSTDGDDLHSDCVPSVAWDTGRQLDGQDDVDSCCICMLCHARLVTASNRCRS